MFHLLIDTSIWLDLSKRRDGQRWIVVLRVLAHRGHFELLVPQLVGDEFERNRDRIEGSMTVGIGQRFKLNRQDLDQYGGSDYEHALKVIEGLTHQVPLIGAMTTRNLDGLSELLRNGTVVAPTDDERRRAVQRGLD